MRRRDFIMALGGAATMPLAARAQPALPVVGLLHSFTSSYFDQFAKSMRQGLGEEGYREGQNVSILERAAAGQYDRLSGLAADLVQRKVAVIFAAGGSDPVKAAKAATTTIPIVFVTAADPVKAGVVTSFNRPEANITGVSLLGSQLEAKRLELLHELIPPTTSIGVLINPKYLDASTQLRELEGAARAVKREIHVARASSESEIDAAVAFFSQKKVGALLATQDPFFNNRREQLVALTAYHKWAAIFNQREFAEAGALASYGTHFRDGYQQAGVYLGKILKGATPADLPVIQPTKFELVINLKTARALGITVPLTLQASADEVIE